MWDWWRGIVKDTWDMLLYIGIFVFNPVSRLPIAVD